LNAGTPLLHAVRLCGEQAESIKLGQILKSVSDKVSGGRAFYSSLAEYPKYFRPHWCEVIHTGEVTGQMGPIVLKLSAQINKSLKVTQKVKSALTYPAILLVVAVAAITIMLTVVVPTFSAFFKDFGAKLPAITQFVVDLSDMLRNKSPQVVGVLIPTVAFLVWYLRTPGGKRNFDALLMASPFLSKLMVQSAMEKFGSNMALMLKSGMPLLDSLKTTRETFYDNSLYFDALGLIHSHVSRGNTLSKSMESTALFTPMVLSVTKLGEESGKLGDVLEQVSNYYAEILEVTVTQVTGLLEPMIVIFMGVVVGGMLASIYIPMFQMASGPSGGG
jgi:type IV pilus assembly protein PilC